MRAVCVAGVQTLARALVVNEDTALAVGGVSVTDVDGNLSTVQLAVANGTVTVTLSGTATISAGRSEERRVGKEGRQGDMKETLESKDYQGTLNYNGPDTLTVTSPDSNVVTDVDTVAITVLAVYDEPVASVLGVWLVNERVALGFGGVSVTDVDGNLSTVQLAVANGTVTVTLSGTATISAG